MAPQTEMLFRAFDRDGDGVVTREEFMKAMAENLGSGEMGVYGSDANVKSGAYDGSGSYGGGCRGVGGQTWGNDNETAIKRAMSALETRPRAQQVELGGGNAAQGTLFMDSAKNWQSIADIAKALLVIEADEQLFAEALKGLPGGERMLQALRDATGGLEPLPDDWDQEIDPVTGQKVYINRKTGERTVTRPEYPPPEGWVKAIDPATGQPFYMNPQTGERSVEKPGPLPDGWQASVDQNGRPIYINKSTGETSKCRPELLPPGWKKEIDPATGLPVYIELATGDRNTKNPLGKSAVALAECNLKIDGVKNEAVAQSQKATVKAQQATQIASQAKNMADKSTLTDTMLDKEQAKLARQLKQATGQEEKAEFAAKKAQEQAAQAAAEAQAAQQRAQDAMNHAHHHGKYAAHMQAKAQQAQQAVAQRGQSPVDAQEDLALNLQLEDKQAQEDAQKAAQDAQMQASRLAKLQAASVPGGPLEQLEQVQEEVDSANAAKSSLQQAEKRLMGLEQLMALLQGELSKSRLIVAERGQDAQVKGQRAAAAVRQSQAMQDQLDLHVSGASESGSVMHMSRAEVAQALQQAQVSTAQAQQKAQQLQNRALQTGQASQGATQQLEQARELEEALPNVDETDEAADQARLAADAAKAHADAMAAAARSALEFANVSHQKVAKAVENVQKAKVHKDQTTQKEKAVFQARFGEGGAGALPPGWRSAIDPATGKAYYIGPNGEVSWDKPGEGAWEEAQARKLTNSARKEQEEAQQKVLMAELMQLIALALERVMVQRANLEDIVESVRKQAVKGAADADMLAEQAQVAMAKVKMPSSEGSKTSYSGPQAMMYNGEAAYAGQQMPQQMFVRSLAPATAGEGGYPCILQCL